MLIRNVEDFLAALQRGPYSWPGAYPIYFVCEDGEPLSFAAAKANKHLVCSGIEDGGDWKVVAVEANYEDELYCAHTGDRIESAYGGDDEG